jgi:hypothetical protein
VKPLEDIYNEQYYRRRINNNAHIPIMCAGIIEVLHPKSIIDVGPEIQGIVSHRYAQDLKVLNYTF